MIFLVRIRIFRIWGFSGWK